MKKLLQYLAVIALACSFTSCATLKKISAVTTYETSPQTAEQIIVSAEKTVGIAALTIHEFLVQEKKYTKEIKKYAPAVHVFAETQLRKKVEYKGEMVPTGQMYLMKARAATEAFRENRNAEGQANLKTAIASVKSIFDQTKNNLSQIPALKGP